MWDQLLSPIFIFSSAILIGVYFLITMAILGKDHGVLTSMARYDYARGVITYIFSVATIGMAAALILYALLNATNDDVLKRIQNAKDILSLLLGVFGSIIGYYFASAAKSADRAQTRKLSITAPLLNPQKVSSGGNFSITALAAGGTPPYQFGVVIGSDEDIQFDQNVDDSGWIVKQLPAPDASEPAKLGIKIGVKDATGATAMAVAKLEVTARAAA